METKSKMESEQENHHLKNRRLVLECDFVVDESGKIRLLGRGWDNLLTIPRRAFQVCHLSPVEAPL
jgi:hypothetical protein